MDLDCGLRRRTALTSRKCREPFEHAASTLLGKPGLDLSGDLLGLATLAGHRIGLGLGDVDENDAAARVEDDRATSVDRTPAAFNGTSSVATVDAELLVLVPKLRYCLIASALVPLLENLSKSAKSPAVSSAARSCS